MSLNLSAVCAGQGCFCVAFMSIHCSVVILLQCEYDAGIMWRSLFRAHACWLAILFQNDIIVCISLFPIARFCSRRRPLHGENRNRTQRCQGHEGASPPCPRVRLPQRGRGSARRWHHQQCSSVSVCEVASLYDPLSFGDYFHLTVSLYF